MTETMKGFRGNIGKCFYNLAMGSLFLSPKTDVIKDGIYGTVTYALKTLSQKYRKLEDK